MVKNLIRTIVLLFVLTSTAALGHSFYNSWCCSDADCHPVPCDELIELENGSVKYQEHTAPKERVYPSQDKQCHFCIWGERRCAYTQQGS